MSKPDYPKHLLKLVGENSLIQDTVKRAAKLTDYKNIYVVSASSHIHHIHDQLPMLPADNILVEPDRRGTASCVIAALSHLKKSGIDASEPIIFMHADHVVKDTDSFRLDMTDYGKIAVQTKRMVLMGIKPTYAATSFGYIKQKGRPALKSVYEVESFKEKPNQVTAQQYLDSGDYLWNMGYFIAPLPVYEKVMKAHAPRMWQDYERLLSAKSAGDFTKIYLSFVNEPIDTALIEHVPDLLVAAGKFDWADIGSYGDLHKIHDKDDASNTITGNVAVHTTTNSFIHNATGIPLAVIGLDHVAVIATENGFLVAHKNHDQKVGDVSKTLTTKPAPV